MSDKREQPAPEPEDEITDPKVPEPKAPVEPEHAAAGARRRGPI